MRLRVLAIAIACLSFVACNDDNTFAPTQQPGQTPPSSAPEGTPTYTFIQNTILTPHCNSCHTGNTASAGLDFTSWENLVHNPVRSDLVVPGEPNESDLFVHGQGNVTLTADEAQAIFEWIQAGALNN